MKGYLLAVGVAGVCVGCAGKKPPKMVSSAFFQTVSSGFTYSPSRDEFRIALMLRPQKEFRETAYAQFLFQNPEFPGETFRSLIRVEPGSENVTVVSSPFKDFKTFKDYKVEVVLYSDQYLTEKIGIHVQYVQSDKDPGSFRR